MVDLPLPVQAMVRLGYHVDSRPFVPHLFGIRATPQEADETDIFGWGQALGRWDDRIGVAYFDGKYWVCHMFEATTDPGRVAREGQRGTAVMNPGQYRRAYAIGKHRGHPAIVNWGKVAPDYTRVVQTNLGLANDGEGNEYIGLNIHRGSTSADPPDEVGPFSRGCQVIRDFEDWEFYFSKVRDLAKGAKDMYDQDYMDYTLLLEHQVLDQPPPQGGQAFDAHFNREED